MTIFALIYFSSFRKNNVHSGKTMSFFVVYGSCNPLYRYISPPLFPFLPLSFPFQWCTLIYNFCLAYLIKWHNFKTFCNFMTRHSNTLTTFNMTIIIIFAHPIFTVIWPVSDTSPSHNFESACTLCYLIWPDHIRYAISHQVIIPHGPVLVD